MKIHGCISCKEPNCVSITCPICHPEKHRHTINIPININATQEIERIFYWLRRYGGIRDEKEGKVWLAKDMGVLELRIKKYFKNAEEFNFDNPDMNIDDFGLEKTEEDSAP